MIIKTIKEHESVNNNYNPQQKKYAHKLHKKFNEPELQQKNL